MPLPQDYQHQLNLWAAKGGKTSRRRTLKRINAFYEACQVKHPAQIGKKHVYDFLNQDMADSTRRDYWYAIRQLWKQLGRNDPPKPKRIE